MSSLDSPSLHYFPAPLGGEFSQNEQTASASVNDRIAAATDLGQALRFLLETTSDVSPCDRIGLAFVEEDGRRVVAHSAVASYEPLLLGKGYTEDLHGSSLERVIAQGAPRVIGDLEAYLAEHPRSRSTKLLLREGVHSSMTCPLFVDNRVVGLLFRSARAKHAYDEHHVRLHLAMADRIAQAVEKVYRIEQLEAASRAYIEMLGFVSHELKSPLASLITDGQVLVDGYLGDLEPRHRDKVSRMVGKADYLLRLVREYLDLAQIESGELKLDVQEKVPFAEKIVSQAIDVVRPELEHKRMRLVEEVDASLTWDCDPNLLTIVVVNLLGNAVKYGFEEGEVRLRLFRDGDTLKLSVRNDGPGFPESERRKLFRKFVRLDTPELKKAKGTGVGLYTTWRIVELHGGRIQASSQHGSWAQFEFDLPLRTPKA